MCNLKCVPNRLGNCFMSDRKSLQSLDWTAQPVSCLSSYHQPFSYLPHLMSPGQRVKQTLDRKSKSNQFFQRGSEKYIKKEGRGQEHFESRKWNLTEGQLWDNDDEAIMSRVVLSLKRVLLVWKRDVTSVCVCVGVCMREQRRQRENIV